MTELYVVGYWCPKCREICSVDYDIDQSAGDEKEYFCFRCQQFSQVNKWESKPVYAKEGFAP